MSSLTEIKNETTLATIAENPTANLHYLLFAVVIDVSEPTKLEKGQNYITKLKVIDPSFNYKQELKLDNLKFHKFVHINIFTEKPEDAPKIKYVGDIIRLRRFKFKYTSKGELMGNDVKYSNWLIYSGKKGDPSTSSSYKNYEKNKNRKMNPNEESRYNNLRDWADNFFYRNSIKYINWWNEYQEKNAKGVAQNTDVDLILKCKNVDTKKNKISFADKDGKGFELLITEKPSLKAGNIIKLRCVDVDADKKAKDVQRYIKLTQKSSCLLMPGFSYDYRQFDKQSEAKASPAKSAKSDKAQQFLDEYVTETDKSAKATPKKGQKVTEKSITTFKKQHQSLQVTKIKTILSKLQESTVPYGQKFLIKGHIAGFIQTSPKDIIKMIEPEDKKIHNFGDNVKNKSKVKRIYHFIMHVKDESLSESEFLNAYVLTNEYESKIFDTWNILPQSDDYEAWNKLKEDKLTQFEKKLKQTMNPGNKVNLVVELMMTKSGKPFFKVVDTIFKNF